MSALDCNNGETDEELKSWEDWVGQRVSISGVKFGILRYFGKTHFAEGSWCGVELDEPVGKNNGTVKDVRYFTCKENFGIFAPLSKIEKITDFAGTSGGISIASKSKLPHPKSKLKFIPPPKALPRACETTFREPAKSHLPYFSSNVNELKTNAVNEVYSQQHRFSDSFMENKKCESNVNYFNSNNNKNNSFVDMGHLKIAERNTSTPVDNLFRKHSEKRTVDFLNQTVILNDNKKNSYPQRNISLGILPGDFMLNTTFDVFDIQSLNNEPADKKESTFVVGNVLPDELSRKSLECHISSEEDLISAELEESLGILTPSQMKDFTLSFENNSGNAVQKSPKIRKIESCDDVNELPEFEDNRMYEGLIPDESLDTITEPCSDRHLKDRIVYHSAQVVYPKEQSPQEKSRSNEGFQEENDDKSVEYYLNKTPAQKLLPRELEHLKYDFSLSDFHPLEDINFNVPSATSTPTFLSKPSEVAVSKLSSRRHLNSDLHSSGIDQIIPSTVLNQTYSHPCTNEYPSTPKINVISKLLSDLDPIQVEPFQTIFPCSRNDVAPWEKSNDFPMSEEVHTFESSGSMFEIPVIGECLPNNLNQEATSTILESALELNISSVEKKHSTSSAKFLANTQPLCFSPINDFATIKLQDRMSSFHSDMTNSLEENNKVVCVQSGIVCGNTEDLSMNPSERSNFDANKTVVIIPNSDIESDSHKNEDNGEMKILCGKKVEESNILDTFCYQNTVSKSMTLTFHDLELDQDSITNTVDYRNQSTKSSGSSIIQNVIKNCHDEDSKINVIPSESLKSNNHIELMKTQVIETSDISFSETETIEKNEIAIKDILNETTILNSNSSDKINLCIQDDIGNNVIPDTSKELTLENQIIPQTDAEKCIFNNVTEPRKLESPVFSVNSFVISKETEQDGENKTSSLDVTRVVDVVECKENNHADNFNVTVTVVSSSIDVKSVKKSSTSWDKNVAKSASGPKNLKNNAGKPVNSKKPDDIKNVSVKPPKKNVVSKIKMMLESSKTNSASNQENVNSKPSTTNPKKVGKWDNVTSKIAASLADNKKKFKKEVTSRVNTNLNASRQLTPKTSPRPSIAKCTKRTENKKSQLLNETTVATNLKNTLNSQKVCDDSKSVCSAEENAERDLRILSQLQNVANCNKPSNDFKEPSVNLKKKKMGLSKAPDRASQSDSASSFGSQISLASSKIATLQLKSSNPLRIVSNRSQKANITSLSGISIGIKEKEQPAKSETGKIPTRRHNTLPRMKQITRSVFQRH